MHRTGHALHLALAGVLGLTGAVSGIYVRHETQTVPVARLAANLERDLAADPKNADTHLKLARLYGMAYSVNADEVPVSAGIGGVGSPRGSEEVWFGHEPDLVPYAGRGVGKTRGAASREYLQKSLTHYKAALALNPESLTARLGYGWTLEATGDKPAAVAEYRKVVEEAWPKEQNTRATVPGQRFYTAETAGYLIPLLDPVKDAKERTELERRLQHLARIPRAITPIAIPLVDDLPVRKLVDLDAAVLFDADGSGFRRQWTWIAPQAGWLVYDAPQKGQISSALQWFGNVTFWLFWNNGYEALAALDDDGDGELKNRELRYLALWRDVNGNGISEPGEVHPLSRHGIVGLSCRYTRGDGLLIAAQSQRGVRFESGKTRPSYDVILRTAISVSSPD
jgi:tetratricopeptide (TPR) repeat protein